MSIYGLQSSFMQVTETQQGSYNCRPSGGEQGPPAQAGAQLLLAGPPALGALCGPPRPGSTSLPRHA